MFKMKIITRAAIKRLTILGGIFFVFLVYSYFTMIKMPGKSYSGQIEPLNDVQNILKQELIKDVKVLADEIGERSLWHDKKLALAADYIDKNFTDAGYAVQRQIFTVEEKNCCNIIAEHKGSKNPEEIVIIGAHYDSAYGTAGANDNATGVAAMLALSRKFSSLESSKTLRFVAFVNEEPPYYHTEKMGSMVYAKSCREKNENVIAMISLETIGYYSNEPDSQKYPFPFNLIYPSEGNFVAFISNTGVSRRLLTKGIKLFRENCNFPSEGGAIPQFVPGAGWSDHWSFWQYDYPAIMITDTAYFRYQYYHSPSDTFDKIDYDSMAKVVSGIEMIIRSIIQN